MNEFKATIDGRAIPAETTFDVINPATGETLAQCPDCSPSQLDRAVTAAQRAYDSWSRTPEDARRERMRACADAIAARAEEIGMVLCQEQGKPLAKAIQEIHMAALWFSGIAEVSLPRQVLHEDENMRVEQVRKPLGVVGAITAWNFPVAIAAFKIAPALLAGNTVVLKPSPFTPLSTLMLGDVIREVLPAGVVNVVAGGDELGARMTSHPGIRKLSFTGSVATGKKIAEAGARNLARVTLELGGNDAAIVLPDVDVKATAGKIFMGAFENSGQICIAIKRVYVHADIADEFKAEMIKLAESARVGDGMHEGTELGPLNNRPQLERVGELVDDAVDAGAQVLTGGKRMPGNGYFYEPTLLGDVTDDMRIVAEEQFGPALPILTFTDVDDAIARANATEFGLGGSIWTGDLELGARLAERLDCGTAWVNQSLMVTPNIPFGGAKCSGIGLEGGREGVDAFTQAQVINIAKG